MADPALTEAILIGVLTAALEARPAPGPQAPCEFLAPGVQAPPGGGRP
jgi:hypothetical protein